MSNTPITYETYVMHYTPLKQRKEFMAKQLAAQDIHPHFIECFDKEALTSDIIDKFDTTKLNMAEISLFCKHMHTWEHMSGEYALFLEDDAILDADFKNKLDGYLKQMPSDCDMLFIGDGCNLHIPSYITQSANTNIFVKTHDGPGSTRCTDSIVVRKTIANKLLEVIKSYKYKIKLPVDWFLNVTLRALNAHVYWAEPTIVSQGSQNGEFTSAIR